MSETITIKLRSKKARALLEKLEDLKVIKIVEDKIPSHWSPKKKQQAKDFLAAFKEAKLAEEGRVQLKTAQSLLDEL